MSLGFPRSSLVCYYTQVPPSIPYSVFFRRSKIIFFRSLTAQNEYFSARPAHVRRGVVHVCAQETKIKLTKIHIFLRRTKI